MLSQDVTNGKRTKMVNEKGVQPVRPLFRTSACILCPLLHLTIIPGGSDDRVNMQAGTSPRRILWLVLVLVDGTPLFAQRELMTFGVKGGVQINSSFHLNESESGGTETNYHKPALGLSFQIPLSQGISIEANALFNQEQYRYYKLCIPTKQGCSVTTIIDWETHGHTLEFPVVLKKYWEPGSQYRVFAEIGISARSTTLSSCNFYPTYFCSGYRRESYGNFGFVFGGGVDIRNGRFHFYPELRYTRWPHEAFPRSSVRPNPDEFKVLFGFSYAYVRQTHKSGQT